VLDMGAMIQNWDGVQQAHYGRHILVHARLRRRSRGKRQPAQRSIVFEHEGAAQVAGQRAARDADGLPGTKTSAARLVRFT
jgi:hypothetical protein